MEILSARREPNARSSLTDVLPSAFAGRRGHTGRSLAGACRDQECGQIRNISSSGRTRSGAMRRAQTSEGPRAACRLRVDCRTFNGRERRFGGPPAPTLATPGVRFMGRTHATERLIVRRIAAGVRARRPCVADLLATRTEGRSCVYAPSSERKLDTQRKVRRPFMCWQHCSWTGTPAHRAMRDAGGRAIEL